MNTEVISHPQTALCTTDRGQNGPTAGLEPSHRCKAGSIMIYRNWPALASRAVRNLISALILMMAISGFAFAVGFPSTPHTLSDFEDVWDYVVLNDIECIEFHYEEKQSVNVYQKYRNIIDLMVQKYRYVHPEYFNYLRLEDCSFIEDEGERYGFTMVLDFGDLSSRVKREYYAASVEQAEELYHAVTDRLSPSLPQRVRARLLCSAVAQRVVYKNDGTGLCHTAYCALVNGYAVCDGYTSLLNMLLRMDGIECEGRLGYTDGGLHEWTYAKLDGEWVNMDATWFDGGCPAYMEMTDEEIARTHTADLSYQELAAKETLQEKLRQDQNSGIPALSNAYDSKQYEIPHYT